MAYVYTNEHRFHAFHLLGQFHMEEISSHLAVNLLENI